MNVVSFYRFADVVEPRAVRDGLQTLCDEQQLLGTVLIATEGVNGTLAGEAQAVKAVLQWLQVKLSLESPIEGRWTDAGDAPFRRMRVKLKAEIVTLGRPDLRPHKQTGKHVSPADWNDLIARPETLLIDTRNHYEVEVGTFQRALDPGTDNFRQFVEFANDLASGDKNRPIAMFCTGGIRCEKATALMLELGFSDVNQLQGGILNYLESTHEQENFWSGECFVFDTRVAVDRDLAEGGYVQCHACRRPLSSDDLESDRYREGVSCHRCFGDQDAARLERLEERRKQVALAKERGQKHIGAIPD